MHSVTKRNETHFGLLVDRDAVAQEEVDHVELAEMARRVQRRIAGLHMQTYEHIVKTRLLTNNSKQTKLKNQIAIHNQYAAEVVQYLGNNAFMLMLLVDLILS